MTARRALLFSYVDRYATLLVQLVTSMVIARLLTPEQFGVFSITAVLVGFVGPFRDLGASQYLINTRELNTQGIRAVWALQLTLGGSIGLALFLLRDVVAHIYQQPEISQIMLVLAANSFAIPFGALTGAWLTRELRFDRLAILRFSGAFTGSVASVAFAWTGHGAISLAYGSLIGSIAGAVVAAWFRPKHFPWLPSFRGVRTVLGMGSSVSLSTMIGLVSGGAPELMAGKLLGITQSGFLARAGGFVSLFSRLVTDSIFAVAQPVFARLNRESADMGDAYVRAVAMLTGIGWPMLAVMLVLASPMMTALYGWQWAPAVHIAQILCASAIVGMLTTLAPTVLVATQRHWLSFRIQVVNSLVYIVFAAAGAFISLEALAWSMLCAKAIGTAVWLAAIRRVLPLRASPMLSAIKESAMLTVAASAAPIAAVNYMSADTRLGIIALLSAAFTGGAAGFILTARHLDHPLWREFMLLVRRLSPALRT